MAFRGLIDRICGQGSRRKVLERFKSHFAEAAGVPYHRSSNEGWASSDLDYVMTQAAENAPLFIEAFWDGCEKLKARYPNMAMPPVSKINSILNDTGFRVDPPRLLATRAHVPIAVPDRAPSLDDLAEALIQDALTASERALREGDGRQAVQKMLWLLETISTAFRSNEILEGSIKGRYFNRISRELRQRESGHLRHILRWLETLHGYLSDTTGGGVRHGMDLEEGLELGINEARLFCDLIRSYLKYLISEHERLST